MGGGVQQLHVHLEGGVPQEPEQLGLGLGLGGHEVEDGYFQRADVLHGGPLAGHDEDVLGLQHLDGWQVGLDTYGHGDGLPESICRVWSKKP